ncbi:hypothetical protein [Paraburkholderia caffeinilytica]|uniref:hypothetical protein n=1 Tax=Paraburkholderia caffeinilytica TaxID=1761016 RepID=UPI0013BE9E8B|nr:hypothetical protein [Paraburkholderia caffeinilytica]
MDCHGAAFGDRRQLAPLLRGDEAALERIDPGKYACATPQAHESRSCPKPITPPNAAASIGQEMSSRFPTLLFLFSEII